MKSGLLFGLLAGVLVQSVLGQGSLAKVQSDLQTARVQLRELQQETASEEGPLVEKVEELDERVLAKAKELRRLLAEEKNLVGKQKRLNDELASRRGEFEYTINTLDGYAKGVLNRLQASEIQVYKEQVNSIRSEASVAGEDLGAEIKARLEAIRVGASRLKKLSGGQLFEGQAVSPSGDIKNGDFALLGPVGYFASKDGGLCGLTALNDGDLGLPLITVFEGEPANQVATFVANGDGPLPVDATGGKAIEAQKAGKSASDYLDGGGVVGYGILGLGLVALVIAGFKVVEIRFLHIPTLNEVNVILDSLLAHRQEDAMDQAKKVKGLSGEMVKAGVEHFFHKRRVLEDALLEKLSAIQPRLERLLPFLALVAAAAPMMGLLGTVLGIMKTFDLMAVYGTGNAKNFSAGIGEALITTAMGLVVAIPVLVVHGMLKSLARGRFDRAQGVALAILNGTTEIEEKPVDRDEPDGVDDEDFDELELQTA